MDLASVDLVEELHHDEDVEDNGVVFRRGCMEGGIATAVNVEELLSYGNFFFFHFRQLCFTFLCIYAGKEKPQCIGQYIHTEIFIFASVCHAEVTKG